MAKKPKIVDPIFSDIIHNESYNDFLENDGDKWIPDIQNYINLYKSIIDENEDSLNALALIEEIILQLRAKVYVDIKLSKVNGYIYARAPFYKRNSRVKDIRVVVGKTSEYGEKLDLLLDDDDFYIMAQDALYIAMDREINNTKKELKKLSKTNKIVAAFGSPE